MNEIVKLPSTLSKTVQVVDRSITHLRPYERNARTHSPAQIKKIAASIKRFGFMNPVLCDQSGRIIAGHGRVEAAKLLGMATVPTMAFEHLSAAEIRAYVIADNRLAELAGWDKEILAIELQSLLSFDNEIDITLTGFDLPEVDFLIQGLASADPADDDVEIDENAPLVTQAGDLWLLGPHRLLCGNALDAGAYGALMGSDLAQVVFTDPPYNVKIDHHVCGLGAVKHQEFAMASGEMSVAEFTTFLTTAFTCLASVTAKGAAVFACMDWRHLREILDAGDSATWSLKNLCVWNKTNAGMGSLYRSKHELVLVFQNGSGPFINNVELGANGRYRTNVWDYAGANSFHTGRMEELTQHPTVKPVAMVADALLDCSHRGGLVLDPFGGSGTTLLAAERTGRIARLMELEPRYCDVAIRRWEKMTGKEAVLAETGMSFNDTVTIVRKEIGHGA